MCGKFTQKASWKQIHDYAAMLDDDTDADDIATVTPMRFASVIMLDESGAQTVQPMRWGFAKRGAQAPGARPDHIHARAETLSSKPTFRDAFAARRGILAVQTFNEGKELSPRKTEQHTITPRDGKPLGIAVLWARRTHQDTGDLFTFVMVTVPANALIATITDRMPAVLPPEDWPAWLGETDATPTQLATLLRPYDGACRMAPEQIRRKAPKVPTQPDLF